MYGVLDPGLLTFTPYQRRHCVVLLCSNQPPSSILWLPNSPLSAEITPPRSMRYSVVRVIRPDPPVAATSAAPAAAACASVSAVQAVGRTPLALPAKRQLLGRPA